MNAGDRSEVGTLRHESDREATGTGPVKTIEHWIAGRRTSGESDRTAPVFNPATGAKQAEVVLGTSADVQSAVAAAAAAFPAWSQTSVSKRAKILFAFRELVNANATVIAEAITDEHGKVLSDASVRDS